MIQKNWTFYRDFLKSSSSIVLSLLETFTGKLEEKVSASEILVDIWCCVRGCGQLTPSPLFCRGGTKASPAGQSGCRRVKKEALTMNRIFFPPFFEYKINLFFFYILHPNNFNNSLWDKGTITLPCNFNMITLTVKNQQNTLLKWHSLHSALIAIKRVNIFDKALIVVFLQPPTHTSPPEKYAATVLLGCCCFSVTFWTLRIKSISSIHKAGRARLNGALRLPAKTSVHLSSTLSIAH